MECAYFLENQGVLDMRSNTPVFKQILKLKIKDCDIFSDLELSRPELHTALDILQKGDRLIVRSIQDLADTEKNLLEVLQRLSDEGVELASCEEPYLNGYKYLNIWCGVLSIYLHYKEDNRRSAYQTAKEKGIVGRPSKAKQKAMEMINSGCFTKVEIQEKTGISKSTLYRYFKNVN